MYDLALKYWGYIDSDSNNRRASIILLHLEQYVNGVIIQNARIQRTRKTIDKKHRNELNYAKINPPTFKSRRQDFSLVRLYCDYHFYSDCIGQINKLLKGLKKELQSPDIERIHNKFWKIFGKYVVLRNDLEHIDERAIGKKHGNPIYPISDLGNF
ncbi:MAG: hypothetical protein PHQ86_09145 [Dehalococcoidales bacterium]|nr:hypothetical protein [Dehalococcoidales bacterium]